MKDSGPVQRFFVSWKNLISPIKPMETNTKRAEAKPL